MSSRLAEMEQTQAILKAQLEATVANAARIADERDILMELNNSLHADLNRTAQCSCASQHHHIIEDKRKFDGACCHESNVLERGTRQNISTEQKASVSKSKLHVEGNMAKYSERMSASEDITHKGTTSQHANLKYLVRRQEAVHVNKPKVRNYNIKDDDIHI